MNLDVEPAFQVTCDLAQRRVIEDKLAARPTKKSLNILLTLDHGCSGFRDFRHVARLQHGAIHHSTVTTHCDDPLGHRHAHHFIRVGANLKGRTQVYSARSSRIHDKGTGGIVPDAKERLSFEKDFPARHTETIGDA